MDGRSEPTPALLSSTRRSGRIGRYGPPVSGRRVARPRIKTVAPAVLSGGESCDLTLSGEPRAGSQDRVPGARRHCTKILRICAEKLCDLRHRLARTLDNGPEQACRSLRGCASHPPNGPPALAMRCPAELYTQGGGRYRYQAARMMRKSPSCRARLRLTEPQSCDIGRWGIYVRPVAQHVVLRLLRASAGPSAGYGSGKSNLGTAIQSGVGRCSRDDLCRLPPMDGWTSFINDRSTKSAGAAGRSRLAPHPI